MAAASEDRRHWAVQAVREAIVAASDGDFDLSMVGPDDDLLDDLSLNPLELVSLCLIVEEIFSIDCPDPTHLFETAHHRSAASLAEWAIRETDRQAWGELNHQRRRA